MKEIGPFYPNAIIKGERSYTLKTKHEPCEFEECCKLVGTWGEEFDIVNAWAEDINNGAAYPICSDGKKEIQMIKDIFIQEVINL